MKFRFPWVRHPLLAAFSLTLLGCTQVFAPQVSPAITSNLVKANDSLGRIVACIELGSCAGRAQFQKVEDDYVNAFAAVNTAKLMASQLETQTRISGTAKDLFVDEITECETAIRRMHDAHKKFPTLQGAGLAGPTQVTCLLPLDAARALQ